MEIWKTIDGFDYPYEISNLGNVKNNNPLLPRLHNQGYLKVTLIQKGKKKDKYIHRLVAQLFIPNYSENLVVNHKDGNKKNNLLSNLECITQKDNVNHGLSTGLNPSIGENYRLSKLSSQNVKDILSSNAKTGIELAREYNVSPAQISRIRNNKSRKYEQVSEPLYRQIK